MTPDSRIIELPASFEAVNDYAYAHGWTDGLPIVPPTEERVRTMVKASGRPPSNIVGVLGPKKGLATVEKVAAQAVMAGCLPEYMPVILAIVEGLADPAFNLDGIQSTTSPCGPFVIVNGPVVSDIEMNTGRDALGPGNLANATLGRVVRLLLLNVGGGIPETVDKAILGFPGKYSLCFGELEEANPWEPLHVEHGFKRDESTVTVVGAQGTSNILTAMWFDIYDMLDLIADAMSYLGGNNMGLGQGEPLVILAPGHADLARKAGLSKNDAKKYLFEKAGQPVDRMPRRFAAPRMLPGLSVVSGIIKPCRRWEDIMVVVAGGPEPYHAAFLPTFGDTWSVTTKVKLP